MAASRLEDWQKQKRRLGDQSAEEGRKLLGNRNCARQEKSLDSLQISISRDFCRDELQDFLVLAAEKEEQRETSAKQRAVELGLFYHSFSGQICEREQGGTALCVSTQGKETRVR